MLGELLWRPLRLCLPPPPPVLLHYASPIIVNIEWTPLSSLAKIQVIHINLFGPFILLVLSQLAASLSVTRNQIIQACKIIQNN